jgi:hypothetical protein
MQLSPVSWSHTLWKIKEVFVKLIKKNYRFTNNSKNILVIIQLSLDINIYLRKLYLEG